MSITINTLAFDVKGGGRFTIFLVVPSTKEWDAHSEIEKLLKEDNRDMPGENNYRRTFAKQDFGVKSVIEKCKVVKLNIHRIDRWKTVVAIDKLYPIRSVYFGFGKQMTAIAADIVNLRNLHAVEIMKISKESRRLMHHPSRHYPIRPRECTIIDYTIPFTWKEVLKDSSNPKDRVVTRAVVAVPRLREIAARTIIVYYPLFLFLK